MGFLDYIFPKRCVSCRAYGSYLCSQCFSYISFDVAEICLVCNKQAIDGRTHPACQGRYIIDGASASIIYKGIVKKLIYAFKYKPYLTDIRPVLGDLLYEGLIQRESFMTRISENCSIVPIPLYKKKLRERGYNQAEILGKDAAKRLGLPFHTYLQRKRMTKPQFGLSKEERKANMKDVFALQEGVSFKKGQTIFLIDDVFTSGVTMLEAARVLKKAGANRVWGIALAHGN